VRKRVRGDAKVPERLGYQTRGRGQAGVSGFSLIELLVVVAIVAVLGGVILATLAKVRATATNFVCKNNLKTVAFEFAQFTDEFSHPYRGDSEEFGRSGFYIEDFQERLYGVSEFWTADPGQQVPYDASDEAMMCPSGPGELYRQSGMPVSQGAVCPPANVSVGLNMRLARASVQVGTRWILQPIRLTQAVRRHPSIPLAFDVDGATADERRLPPYYAAPAAGDPGQYGTGQFWFPGLRHGDRLNAAFVGGYVLSSHEPEAEPGWNWEYQGSPSCFHPNQR